MTHSPGDDDDDGGKRKRNKYVSKACAECKRRKIKCDGQCPCLHCETVSTVCEYVEGKARGGARKSGISTATIALDTSSNPEEDVYERLTSLERKVESLSNAASMSNIPLPGATPIFRPTLPSITQGYRDGTASMRNHSTTQFSPGESTNPFYGQSSSRGTFSLLRDRLCSMAPPVVKERLDNISTPVESVTPKETVLISGSIMVDSINLPSKSEALGLLHTMFDDLVSMYPLLHPPTFYDCYSLLWDSTGEFQRDIAFSENFTMSEMGLMYACMAATAVLNDPKNATSHSGSSSLAHKYYLSAKLLILDQKMEKSADLEAIQAMVMLALYFLHVENEDASYKIIGTAIRMAFELGLHLRSHEAGHSAVVIELRRRAWYCLYLLDRRTSISLGRPCGVQNFDMNVDFPTPIDDCYPFPKQLEVPIVVENSKIPYLIHFVRFSSICGDIYEKVYGVKCVWPPRTQTVQELDEVLNDWRLSLPSFLQFNANTVGRAPKWQGKQTLFLYLRGNHVRLLLLKPFVSEVVAGTILEAGSAHHRLVDLAIQLSADIIHTISLIKRTSDLVEMLWYPSKQMLLTTIGIIFSVVLNLGSDPKFSALSSRADLRVALQLLKDFSEKSPGSKKNLREIQFLRYLLNQALKGQSSLLSSASMTRPPSIHPEQTPSACLPGDSQEQMNSQQLGHLKTQAVQRHAASLESAAPGINPPASGFDMTNVSDLSFLDMHCASENDLLLDLLDSMGEKTSGQMFLSI